jgi:4-hydroxybenzoate polyprenyltransferase
LSVVELSFPRNWVYIYCPKEPGAEPLRVFAHPQRRDIVQSLRARVLEMKPAFTLVYLSAMGFLCLFSVHRYLGVGFQPLSCVTFMGMIFGIYTLNRFTDTAEDFTNDLGRLLFFQRKRVFLYLAVACLAASLCLLAWTGKFNWMHTLLLAMGFAYSYRIVPWWSPAAGFRLLRIKEMTFLKNLAVSFLWGSSVFVLPVLYSGMHRSDGATVWLLAVGLGISTLNNTLFDDIIDEPGDRVAGIKTLPTAWGVARSRLLLQSLDVVWIGAVAALFALGKLDASHAAFLAFLGLYPFVYMGLHTRGKLRLSLVDLLSESDLLFFALGMLLLSLR